VEKLKNQTELSIDWVEPGPAPEESILRAHSPEHLAHLKDPSYDFDADTPAYPHIDVHAHRSVGGALLALEFAKRGELAFNLLRPPGHHAKRDQAMGFCYLNSVAIAALEALATGFKRPAVFDFDVHHGNGTEAILLGRTDCAFLSIHQYPGYPGTGTEHRENCYNYPVLPGASRERYREALVEALEQMKRFNPDLIAVSAGFDAYKRDPLSDEPLEVDDYHWLGESIRAFGVPIVSVLEGGYSGDLPELIFAYLKGLEGKPVEQKLETTKA
jgi:acetoin utilization deacetylase AcuC-like enzyme